MLISTEEKKEKEGKRRRVLYRKGNLQLNTHCERETRSRKGKSVCRAFMGPLLTNDLQARAVNFFMAGRGMPIRRRIPRPQKLPPLHHSPKSGLAEALLLRLE